MNKPLVYIASPYTKGDACINARFQMATFDALMSDGLVLPFAPLISHFQHTAFPRPYQDWLDWDLAFLSRVDAVLRLNAELKDWGGPGVNYFVSESSGADKEVARAGALGKPVFYSKADLYAWVKGQS